MKGGFQNTSTCVQTDSNDLMVREIWMVRVGQREFEELTPEMHWNAPE